MGRIIRYCWITSLVQLLSFFLFGCNQGLDTFPTPATDGRVITLRSIQGSFEAPILLSIWGSSESDSLLITDVHKQNNGYVLQKSIKSPAIDTYVSAVYPNNLFRTKQYVLVSHSNQQEVYYYGGLMSAGNDNISLSLSRVQSQINFSIDLSSFPKSSILEEVSLSALYEYGWINLVDGSFATVEGSYEQQMPVSKTINQEIKSLVDSSGSFDVSFYTIPASEQELMLRVTIDGRTYISSVPSEKLSGGIDYKCSVNILNKYTPVVLEENEKKYGRGDVLISQPSFPDFEYTVTSSYFKKLSNHQGAVFEFWLDSRVDQKRNLEYKLLIRDKNHKIVSESPTFGGLSVQPYHYEGFRLPIYIDVPEPGKYMYQLLLRNKGEQAFYEPAQRGDDLPRDKELDIHEQQNILTTSFQLGETNKGSSSITPLKYDKKYNARITLSNYSSLNQDAVIRLYHRRNPLEDHSNLSEIIDETPISSWQDKVGEMKVTVSGMTSKSFQIPFMITVSHPKVSRFPSYICATIEYNNGKELPLLIDGTLIYKYSYNQYNPNPYIDGAGVYNLAYIQVD